MPVPRVQTVEKIVEVPVPDVQTVEKIVEEPQHATSFDIEAYWEERRMLLKRRMDEEDEMDEEHQAWGKTWKVYGRKCQCPKCSLEFE